MKITTQKEAELLETLGALIHERMVEKKLKVKDIVEASGVNKMVMYKILKGELYTVKSLAAVLVALDMDKNITKL